jgi:hypothetical protein
MLELRDMLHHNCLTVTGKTLGENLDEIAASPVYFAERRGYLKNVKVAQDEIIRPRTDPFGTDGGVAVLYGNLFTLPNVILTPHAAYYSEESIHTVRDFAAHEVVRVLTGQPPVSAVNADQLAGPAGSHQPSCRSAWMPPGCGVSSTAWARWRFRRAITGARRPSAACSISTSAATGCRRRCTSPTAM